MSVLDAFAKEYGIQIDYQTYETQEAAIENMKAGKSFDVVVMESRFIPQLTEAGLLAEIDRQNVPNAKNISPNFRDLAYDPGNRFSVPFSWGTTGLIVRSDLVTAPVTHWASLWDKQYTGRVAVWRGSPRELIGLTLKSLGYSANSVNPGQLEEALRHLIELKPHLLYVEDFDVANSASLMASGKAVIAQGYATDYLRGIEKNKAIAYILPREGALLWNDTFVIPATSPHKYTAELFLNFVLRPDISAQITNETILALPNDAAKPLIMPEILNNQAIFPPNDQLVNAELVLPLTAEEQKLYDSIWERFVAAGP